MNRPHNTQHLTGRQEATGRWHGLAGVALALAISVASTLLLLDWMTCSQAPGTALCGALLMLPANLASRVWARIGHPLRVLHLRLVLRNERKALEEMEDAQVLLQLELPRQQRRVYLARSRLSEATGTPMDRLP